MNEPTPEKLLKLIVAAQKKKTIKSSKETMRWLNELKEIVSDYLESSKKWLVQCPQIKRCAWDNCNCRKLHVCPKGKKWCSHIKEYVKCVKPCKIISALE